MASEKPYETDRERLDFVTGQVHALKAAMLAVISLLPSDKAAHEIERAKQAALANAESVLVSDEYLDGLIDLMNALHQFALRQQARRENLNSPDL